jgi:hypothetical protein
MKRSMSLVPFFFTVALVGDASAAPPPTVRVQGSLSDRSGGTPVPANGTFQMTFRLYDDAVTGALLATSGPGPVQVSGGLYNTDVAFPPSSFAGGSIYLEIQIGAEILSPRIPVVSVPYAYLATQSAGVAPGSVGTAGLAPGAVTADKLGIPCAEGQMLVYSGGAWVCQSAPIVCDPAAVLSQTIPCYDGTAVTRGVGACRDGHRACLANGTGYGGPCQGEVLPQAEICGNGIDDNCDGQIDEPSGPHSNGLGQNYFDCAALGVPGDPATYTAEMAAAARAVWPFSGTDETLFCASDALAARLTSNSCAVWQYAGSRAGRVHLSAAPSCSCPSATDPTWN